MRYKGILSGFKARLQKNRLGELLVLDGVLSPHDLRHALQSSKDAQKPLGRYLVESNIVSQDVIRRTLVEQFTLRFMTAAVTVFISLASMGFAKQARAGGIKDVPSRVSVTDVSFQPIHYYPNLFGSTEKKSKSLKAFTKWTGMFKRFDQSLNNGSGQQAMQNFKNQISVFRGLGINQMAAKVNDFVNQKRYIVDSRNYGKSDYWATPVEFMERGGDCEDFAIAKYTALRALGVPEERLRIAIVQDTQKNIPHAVLIVYSETGPLILDNQIKSVSHANRIDHYKPIFSINRQAWWLHTAPKQENYTVIASAAQ